MYSIPIITAFCSFPFIALIITFPYILVQYGKYGSINKMRTVIVYSFILYLLCAYFLVILPLPEVSEVSSSVGMELKPFRFIGDIINNSPLDIKDPGTYLSALSEPHLYQVLYNLILLLPLGVYLRYYFGKKFISTTLIVFLVSLFFEVTQLTGLYGIYPYAYRLFDVDDLIINTLGGALGYVITPLLSFFLPTRKEIDEDSYKKGNVVSKFRRFIAFLIDFLFIIFACSLFTIFFKFPNIISILSFENLETFLFYFFYVLIYFGVIPIFTKGKTLGKKLVNIKLYKEDIKYYEYIFRAFLLYLVVLPSFRYSVILIENVRTTSVLLSILLSLLNILLIVFFIVNVCIFLFSKKKKVFHEKVTNIINVSTIELEEKELEKEEDKEKKDTKEKK